MTQSADTNSHAPALDGRKSLSERIEDIRPGIERRVLKGVERILPRTLTGDRIYALAHFILRQRRLPRRRMLFNDYLLRLKLSGEFLSLTRQLISDKELCKLYVDNKIGPGRTIPTLAVFRSPDEIREQDLPDSCVIKSTHSWNTTLIRRNGEPVDLDRVRSYFDDDHYPVGREMNYKYLEPKVIVEPIVFDGSMIEFKVHCYKGRAKVISVQLPEDDGLERFDRSWNRMPVRGRRRPQPVVPSPRPACLDEVMEACDVLSRDFEYMRVDAYIKDDKWLIGELTNCHTNIDSRFVNLKQEEIFSKELFS